MTEADCERAWRDALEGGVGGTPSIMFVRFCMSLSIGLISEKEAQSRGEGEPPLYEVDRCIGSGTLYGAGPS